MDIGIYIIAACAAFGAVLLAVPLVSWLFLRRERARLAATSRPAPLASVFFTEVLLWLAASCVAAMVLALLLVVVALANSHPAGGLIARREVTVPWQAPAAVCVLLAVLGALGFGLHRFTASRLLPPAGDPQNTLQTKDR